MKKLIIAIALVCAPAFALAGDFTMVLGGAGDGHKLIITSDDRGETHISNAFKSVGNAWVVFDDKGGSSTVYDYSRGNDDRRYGEDD